MKWRERWTQKNRYALDSYEGCFDCNIHLEPLDTIFWLRFKLKFDRRSVTGNSIFIYQTQTAVGTIGERCRHECMCLLFCDAGAPFKFWFQRAIFFYVILWKFLRWIKCKWEKSEKIWVLIRSQLLVGETRP